MWLVAALAIASLGSLAGPGGEAGSDSGCPPGQAFAEARSLEGRSLALSCVPGPRAAEKPVRGPARLLVGERLDLNRAPAAWLEVLPGIGPSRASAIVLERERLAFRGVDDLARVAGIGPRTVSRLRGWVDAGQRSGDALAEDGTP